jgi:hypothetical protein
MRYQYYISKAKKENVAKWIAIIDYKQWDINIIFRRQRKKMLLNACQKRSHSPSEQQPR